MASAGTATLRLLLPPPRNPGEPPMKTLALISILIASAMLLSAVPLVIAEEDERGRSADRRDDEESRASRGKEGPRTDDGDQGPRKSGRIVVDNGSFNGRYVDFHLDAATCTITDYRVYNQTFFDAIRLPGPCESPKKGGAVHGAEVDLRSADARLRIHDAPNGLLRFETEDGAMIHIDLGAGLVSNQTEKGVELAVGNLSGLLRIDSDNESSVDFSNATAGDVEGDGRFWVHPLKGSSEERQEIRDAVKKGKVAGEIDVLVENGTTSTQILQYDDVIIKAGKKDNSTYRFLVDANFTEGRTFVVNLGPGVFKAEKIGVRYYDIDNTSAETEVPITQADDLQDVLSIDADEGPEYWIVKDEAGKHVLVAVPSFSVHAFEVMSLGSSVAPIIVGGVVAALAVVAVAAVGVLRPRRA